MGDVLDIKTGRTRFHDQMLQFLYRCITNEAVIASAMQNGLDGGPVDDSDIKMAGLMVKETMMTRSGQGRGLTEPDTASLLLSLLESRSVRRAIVSSVMDSSIKLWDRARSVRQLLYVARDICGMLELSNAHTSGLEH